MHASAFDLPMNQSALIILVVGLILAFIIIRGMIIRRKRVIPAPRFGLLDLSSGAATAIIAEDQAALSAVLGAPTVSTSTPPACDVLFIYGQLDHSTGCFTGSELHFREILRRTGATVVVIASDHDPTQFRGDALKKRDGQPAANWVLTISRRGDRFSRFFHELFSRMKAGTTMPVAWVALAPQIPHREQTDCPETIFLCEAGGIAFR